jgi:hypothetical protein
MTLIEERVGRERVIPGELDVAGGPGGRLGEGWAPVLVGAWVTIFGLGVALEPAPAGEEAFPVVGQAFALVLMGCWAVMAAGISQKRRYGAVASAVGGASLLVMTVACPLSGHHAGIGIWWWFQLAGALTLLGLSRAALASRSSHKL